MIKILFVCHGNICRSPMAEFIMKDLVQKAGLEGLASGHHSTRLAAENRRLRANNLELEMELAVQQKYQQICWRRD